MKKGTEHNRKAFEGVRILDLTQVLSGPFCTMLLADMGAEVIKIERPDTGDSARNSPICVKGESLYFMSLNRGKKSVVLDLKNSGAIDVFKDLVRKADVVIENFRPDVMNRLGIGYAELKGINPRIIFASISGFGATSPFQDLQAYDLIAQALSGIMSVNGHPDQPPTRVGVSVGDTVTGLFAAYALTTALYAREKHGVGQQIDISMVDSLFSLLEVRLLQFLADGKISERTGSAHPVSYPYDAFKCADGYFVIATRDNVMFGRLCKVMGRKDLPSNDRFSTDAHRGTNRDELKEIIEDWARTLTTEKVTMILKEASVPAAPVWNIEQIANSTHIREREMLVEVDHPIAGRTKLPGVSVKMSETPGKVEGPAPLLGEHTETVLTELLGYEKSKLEELKKSEVLGRRPDPGPRK